MIGDIFLDKLPKIDLHGYDRDSARVAVLDFIDEAVQMKYQKVIIIHGIGTGVVKETVHDTLAKNKKVISYQLDVFNVGCTIVFIKL